MTKRFTIVRTEVVPATSLVCVFFTYGAADEGNVCVDKSMLNTPKLDAVINLQLDRLQAQREQLAAGGE